MLVADDPRAVLGAAASAIYGDPTARLTMIGITGTAGKTSTAYLVESGLRAAGLTTGLIGTVETRLGDLVIDSVRTTPEATDLHAMLAAALERGVTAVVMEVSSHALAMGRVGGVRFAVGGYTNFGLDHLDFHADADDYFAAKARLFDGRCRVEVLNLDDPALRPLFKPATITYSAAGDADGDLVGRRRPAVRVRPAVHRARPGRRGRGRASRCPAGTTWPTRCSRWPRWSPSGSTRRTAARGIAACPGVPGRLEQVTAPGDVLGVVDYAHKPDAIVAALAALRELATARGGRLICVIGAGGDRDRGKRPLMGAAAARGADLVVVTDDNPRTEDPAAVRAAVRAGAEQAAAPAKIIEVGRAPGGDRRGGPAGRAGRRGRGAGQGTRAGPGGERRGAAVRRPDRAGRRAGRAAPGRCRLIRMTLDEIAAITGGRLVNADPAAVVTGPVEYDSRKVAPGRAVRRVRRGEGGRPRLRGHGDRGRRRGCSAPGTPACPAIVVDDQLAALARLARAVVDRLPRPDRGRADRLVRQDHHQGLHRPAAGPARADGRAGRLAQQRAGLPVHGAARPTPETRFLVLEMGARGIGHIRHLAGIAPPRIGVVLNVGAAHIGEFGSVEGTARAKGELVEALPPDGAAVLNADDPLVAAMAARTAARVVLVRRVAGRRRPGRPT